MTHIRLFTLIAALLFVSSTLGHSYLTKPTSRSNQKQTVTGCRGPACLGPCDATRAKAKTAAVTIARGATIVAEWPRNNHAGGFIRFAWAKTGDSDSHSSFDAGVQEIHCHEVGGCKPDDPNDKNGGDTAPADGSRQPCRTSIVVPNHLTDGDWTLQWAWFGGAFALGDYYSCVDYKISGGVAVTSSKKDAVFYGGDYSYPGQNKCKYFNTDRLHRCVNEPCDNPVYTLNKEQSGPAFGVPAVGASSSTTTTSQPTPTPAPTPVTTKAKSNPTPTPAPTPTPDPTPAPTPNPTPTPGSCTLGYEECVGSNTYRSCYRISANSVGWSPARSCQSGLVCKTWMEHYVICDRA